MKDPASTHHRARITVLVPTHARSSLLQRTLESAFRCILPEDRSVQICVVENGPREGVEQLLESLSAPCPLIYRYHPVGNKSAAINAVLPELRDDLVVFLDDDVRVDSQLLRIYASASDLAPSGTYFGGSMRVDYEAVPPSWLVDYLPPSAKGWSPPAAELGPREHFFGCNWAAYAADLISTGGFDADFGPGSKSGATGQETVMQKRLLQAGLKRVYLTEAVVWHYVPTARCSPEWALQRARRMATSAALRIPAEKLQRTIFGRPLWLYRELLESVASVAMSPMMGAKERFAARFRLMQCFGTLDGLRERRRRKPS